MLKKVDDNARDGSTPKRPDTEQRPEPKRATRPSDVPEEKAREVARKRRRLEAEMKAL